MIQSLLNNITNISGGSNTPNAIYNPYTLIMDDLKNTAKNRCQFCDDLSKNLVTMISTNFTTYINQLFQLSAEVSNMFKKRQSPRPHDYEKMTNFVCKLTTDTQYIDKFVKQVQITIIPQLTDLRGNYAKQTENIFKAFQDFSRKYEQDYNQYQETYKKYIKHCQNIELTFQKSEKNPAKFQMELNTLRDQCIAYEREAALSCEMFGRLSSQYQNAAEQIMLNFENIERSFFKGVADLVKKLIELMSELENNYMTFYKSASADLAQIIQIEKANVKTRNTKRVLSVIEQFSQMPQFSFNIFEILPASIVFQNDLQASYMTVQQSFGVKTLSLSAGDIVKVISERPTTIRVENMLGIRGKVPRSLLKPNKAFKPRLFQLKMRHQGVDYSFDQGTIVIGFQENPQTMICKDIQGRTGQVPPGKLQPLDLK